MEPLTALLTFKDQNLERKYKDYNLKKKRGILLIQRAAVGLFSFLGIFHLIYMMPKKNEFSRSTEAYLVITSIGLLFSILIGIKCQFCTNLRQKETVIFFTNLLINFILIEPNFLLIAETRDLSKAKYFWLGFRIASINLVTLMCYDSFLFKILQTSSTTLYLIIRMRADTSLHNLLVDPGICILICLFFYIKERGVRMTYQELSKVSLQKESLKDFLRFLPEGVAIFRRDQNCVFMNDSLKKIFQTTNEDEIKGNILNLKKRNAENWSSNLSSGVYREKSLKSQFLKVFEGIRKGKYLKQKSEKEEPGLWEKESHESTSEDLKEIFYANHNGKYLDIKFTPIFFEDMDTILVLITDITFSIKSHMLALEENKNYRDMLFSSFSHEIRTPLNCILLLLGKARKKKRSLSEKFLRKYINPSFQSGQILLHLVNNILDYSFLTQGELRLNISEIDIKTECLEVMEVIAVQAEIKGIRLFLKLDKNLPSLIKTDSSRLKQILCHLLLNAIKFTYFGKITLKITLSKETKSGIALSVKDSGIGMNEHVQNRLKKKLKVSLFPSSQGQGPERKKERKRILNKKHKLTQFTPFKITEESAGASLKTLFCQSLARVIGFPGDDGLKFRSLPDKGSQFRFIIKNQAEEQEAANSKKYFLACQEKSNAEEVPDSGIQVIWIDGDRSSKLINYSSYISSNSKEQQGIQKRTTSVSTSMFKFSLKQNCGKQDTENDQDLLASEKDEEKKQIPIFETKTNSKDINYDQIEANRSCQHSKILVVDDDEFNILAVTSILKHKSFSISSARNGAEAIELVHKEVGRRKYCCRKFSLILMDLNMPVMGGLEATRILKQDMKEEKLPWMPIIGCTAFVGSRDQERCMERGMDGYETKPLNERKLKALIERWVNI